MQKNRMFFINGWYKYLKGSKSVFLPIILAIVIMRSKTYYFTQNQLNPHKLGMLIVHTARKHSSMMHINR